LFSNELARVLQYQRQIIFLQKKSSLEKPPSGTPRYSELSRCRIVNDFNRRPSIAVHGTSETLFSAITKAFLDLVSRVHFLLPAVSLVVPSFGCVDCPAVGAAN
jgi:hypothetical protein